MRQFIIYILLLTIVACNDSVTKADPNDSATKQLSNPADSIINDNAPAESLTKNSDPDDPKLILANIDQYIVSKASFDPPAAGSEGIRNCILTVQNKLSNTSFQKVILEVSIHSSDNKEYRTDYHTIVNIDPGTSKQIKIPNAERGVKVTGHVVKVKSTELTQGETVLTGTHYSPK